MSYRKYKNLGGQPNEYESGDSASGSKPISHSPPEEDQGDSVHLIQSKSEKDTLIKSNKLVVVDIYGEWCGPCKRCAPQYAEFAQKYNRPGKCMLVKEDVDMKFTDDITGVPMFQFFINGTLDGVITGANMKAVEAKIIELMQT